jgi:hypothetical protein
MATPSLLILIPVRNSSEHLENLASLLMGLSYDLRATRLVFMEGDSEDDSYTRLCELAQSLEQSFHEVQVLKDDLGPVPYPQRFRRLSAFQPLRRGRLAKVRNRLLMAALQDEDYVLWIDADLHWWPQDIVETMLAADADVVTPHCINRERTESFDLNTFVFKLGARDAPEHMQGGLMQPPRGEARLYLSDLRDRHEVELDGIGGTMLLIKADAHRDGLNFPAFPFDGGYIETEGLCRMAKAMNLRCIGLPKVFIQHS